MKKFVALALLCALLLAGGWVYASWWGSGPSYSTLRVQIPQGSTVRGAAGILEKADVICCRERFYRYARLFGSRDPIQAGEFAFPAAVAPAGALDILQHGQPVQRLLTIPEGMPSILVQEKLSALPLAVGPAPLPAEGSVLPDSYGYERGESRAAILKRATDAMTKTLDALWKKKSSASVVTSKAEAIILASIVEKETGKWEERRLVAGVYSNRLRIGMKLDADPTVIYPITKGKPLGRRILRSELDADTGYNTYRKPGLPAGPIANPGRASIAAVLDPAPTKALYFVADGTGGHVFADTLAEHNANVAKWFALRRARGQM